MSGAPEAVGDRRRFLPLPGGGYVYELLDEPLRVEVRYLRRERGQLLGEVDVRCPWAGVPTHNGSVSCADLNLSSQAARRSLAKYCTDRSQTPDGGFDWQGAIDAAALEVIQAERNGGGVITLDDATDDTPREIDVLGLRLPADATSLIIAPGDSLKSLIALFVLGTLARRGERTLYVDYEWTPGRHLARKRRLFGADRLEGLHYVRCHAPLAVEVDSLRRYCDTHQITYLAVDSVGLACDGKLGDDDTAVRFHRALGLLPAALCAAHVPKSAIGPDAKGDPVGAFGSIFFTNLCREAWLVRKQDGDTEDVVTVGLFRAKQADGPRHRPVGWQFSFQATRIDVHVVDLAEVEGLAARLPLSTRMVQALRGGPRTYDEVAEETGAKANTIIRTVMRDAGRTFTKLSPLGGPVKLALVARQAERGAEVRS